MNYLLLHQPLGLPVCMVQDYAATPGSAADNSLPLVPECLAAPLCHQDWVTVSWVTQGFSNLQSIDDEMVLTNKSLGTNIHVWGIILWWPSENNISSIIRKFLVLWDLQLGSIFWGSDYFNVDIYRSKYIWHRIFPLFVTCISHHEFSPIIHSDVFYRFSNELFL